MAYLTAKLIWFKLFSDAVSTQKLVYRLQCRDLKMFANGGYIREESINCYKPGENKKSRYKFIKAVATMGRSMG
jgi:hypothetical protein